MLSDPSDDDETMMMLLLVAEVAVVTVVTLHVCFRICIHTSDTLLILQ